MAGHLGPYEIRGELGRGAMAIVWRAFDTRLEREVAIKEPMIPHGTPPDVAAELAARFVREGLAAAKLNHPGIVTVFSADVFDGRAAIIMELIEGDTLGSLLEAGSLSTASAAAILDQLLDAVAYAHSREVVHRDIKPDNVFITNDGRVKLTDFGIAHVGSTAALTQAGTIMGTPGYMAPEQITGEPVDARADIFAIGVLGYEMLVGTNPFGVTEGVAPTTVMYRVVHETPPDPQIRVAGAEPRLSAAILTALSKDPGARYQSADDMRAAIAGRAYGGGLAPTAHVAAPASKKQTWVPYAVVGAMGAIGLVAMIVLSGGSVSSGAGGAQLAPTTQAVAEPPEVVVPPIEVAEEPVPAEPTNAELEAEVSDVVERWRSAWENEQLAEYMSFYASDFYSNYKKMNKSQWKSYKSKLFNKYSSQSVSITTPDVTLSGATAKVVFEQGFVADSYSDFGVKTLKMKRSGTTWLITGEEFQER